MVLQDGEYLRISAHHGPIPIGIEKWPINRRWTAGRAFVDQTPVHIEDLSDEKHADFTDGRELSLRMGHRTILSVPLLREGESIGAIVLRRTEVHPFSDKQIALLQTFADQAVIAIENVRLFEEVAKTRDLREALERQTATADILKVIASSPADVQPVFERCCANANKLIGANATTVLRFVGDMIIWPRSRLQRGGRAMLQARHSRCRSRQPAVRNGLPRREACRSWTCLTVRPTSMVIRRVTSIVRNSGARSLVWCRCSGTIAAPLARSASRAASPARLPRSTSNC